MSTANEPEPEKAVTPTELGQHWGCSRAYASQRLNKWVKGKRGRAPASFAEADQWRKEETVYGVGYRSKSKPAPLHKDDRVVSQEPVTETPATALIDKEAVEGIKELDEGNPMPEPEHPYLRSLWRSLDKAIRMEQRAYNNAAATPTEQCIRAYNNARDGRFAAHDAYMDALAKMRVFVPLEEAKRIGMVPVEIMVRLLRNMGTKLAQQCGGDDAERVLAAKRVIDAEAAGIIRQAQAGLEPAHEAAAA